MIHISDSAQTHFRKLIEREALPGLGVRLSAVDPGTSRADARLEFAEPRDLVGGEEFRRGMNRLEDCAAQLAAVDAFFESQLAHGERVQYRPAEEKLAA